MKRNNALRLRHGSILNFSLLRPDGRYVGYREVEKLACIHGLQLRTGGFCNPGATQHFLGLSHAQVKRHVELGHVCWDDHDLLDGLPTGSVRTSFGYMSSEADVRALVAFVNRFGRIAHLLQDSFQRWRILKAQ